jgi:putative ATP-dependent endonuclease of OLD family
MATKKKNGGQDKIGSNEAAAEATGSTSIGSCKLTRLRVKNFRSIGHEGVDLALDDIVVLVGENNTGKSTIARAYELALEAEEKSGVLSRDDFHKGIVPDEATLCPCIEIETRVVGAPKTEHWRHEAGVAYLRERFTWKAPGEAAIRETYVPSAEAGKSGQWTTDAEPWGAANVRKGKRPKAHRIDAFAPPDKRREELTKLLSTPIEDLGRELLAGEGNDATKKLVEDIRGLREAVRSQAEAQLKRMCDELSKDLSSVFPGYRIQLDPPATGDELTGMKLFGGGLIPRMGADGDFLSTIDRQGAGAQRTLLWALLRFLAANDKKSSTGRGHVLLLDEPEICLHPSAVRCACDTLYALAEGEHGWQVMVTTHSPLFVDLTRDHTTIVRLSRKPDGIGVTELFRSDKPEFDVGDREQLKLLNTYDPYVAEFFFGGRTVLVEGDTEYSAFRRVIAARADLRDVHVVRARGKYLVVLLGRILNHFGASYGVLHDFDHPILKMGKKKGQSNPAWAANEQIRAGCAKSSGKVILVGAVENFEQAVFDKDATSDKPYEAVRMLDKDPKAFDVVERLLRHLSGASTGALPERFRQYASEDDLEMIRKDLT